MGLNNKFPISIKEWGILIHNILKSELDLTPKPGLVDKRNSGSHSDMDYDLMNGAIDIIAPILGEISTIVNVCNKDTAFLKMRQLGKYAEEKMLNFTQGVNTYKGAIFLLGSAILTISYLHYNKIKINGSNISYWSIALSNRELSADFDKIKSKKHNLTYGEYAYKMWGMKGARGEVLTGFDIVLNRFLPLYRKYKQQTKSELAMLYTLVDMISVIDDTNIIHRKGIDFLRYIQNLAKNFLQETFITDVDFLYKMCELDDFFIKNNVSPSGSADLISLVFLFDYFL